MINFAQVSPHQIYRGGQPSGDDWAKLALFGIKTVVKLNYDSEGMDNVSAGMILETCSMPPRDFMGALGGPDEDDLTAAVSILCDETRWPVFVHCTHGQDRTGLVVGLFRLKHDGWTKDEAFAEMVAHGFHPELLDLMRAWNS